ncbi:hypothetical protein MKI84_08435 [Ancylobacter sp. A5.8]|uniref:DUF7168 domain-containing protein n=1 Tax=Ancylobacter gelatini TaxID=2919920 RepID=UPI001F4DDDDE|nr:hypothetical protein [Ancylobacter gelatini]MCJ8142942.1 hypothetical protein [Ancylobacter gelatini]
MTRDLSRLKARLDALRRMTTANGCTEAEALNAAEKAATLLAELGMSDVEIDAHLMGELEIGIGSRRTPMVRVYNAIATFSGCKGWLLRRERRLTYVYFGAPANILIAEYVHEVCRRAADTATRGFKRSDVYLRRRTSKTRAHALRAFQDGFAIGLAGQIMLGLWRRHGVADRPHDERQAVVTVAMAPVEAELARRGVAFRNLPALKVPGRPFRDAARGDGYGAGRSVDIDAPLAGGRAGVSLLTSGGRR